MQYSIFIRPDGFGCSGEMLLSKEKGFSLSFNTEDQDPFIGVMTKFGREVEFPAEAIPGQFIKLIRLEEGDEIVSANAL